MCGPVPLMIASTALSVVGGIQQANAQASAARYSAQVNERNAILAERRARDALDRGVEAEREVRMRGGLLAGKQRAQMAAAGLDLGFGSPMDVLTDTLVGIELDSARARRNAQSEAEDFDRQAWSYRAQAGMDRAEARNARVGGTIGAVGSVLSGASNIYRYRAGIVA